MATMKDELLDILLFCAVGRGKISLSLYLKGKIIKHGQDCKKNNRDRAFFAGFNLSLTTI